MIEIRDLNKSFGEQTVLHDFSYTFEDGKEYLIRGESGIGKTTLLRLITKLETPDSGEIVFDGDATFAMVFQEDRLIDEISAVRNVLLCDPQLSEAEVRKELCRLLPEDQIDKPIRELSGGQKRRTAIVRAMVNDGAVIILDEPFTGLDEDNRRKALAYIREKQNGRTILLCSHEDDDLQGFIRVDLES